ncbi:MAG: formate dehydrogenase accessory sulfurtransferase FdhD, partial [Phycisphaerae bacterium]|nr:formate dehydrogenase accessory sulfurtransferase FdhD [Phycisphaerae bacterium]
MTDLKSKNSYPVMRIDADGTREVNEPVASERGASIRLCSMPVVRLQCLPEGVDDLAVGFLYSEAILTDPAQLRGVSVSEDGETVVDVDANMDVATLEGIHEKMLLTSGCGRGASLDNLDDLDLLMDCRKRFDLSISMKADRLLELMEDFRKRSDLFKATGG